MNRAEYVISDSVYRIESYAHPKRYVDVFMEYTNNGGVVQIEVNTGSKAQAFRIRPTGGGNGAYWIENVNSGKVLEIADARKGEGVFVTQYTNNGSLAQKWYAKRSIYGGCVFVNANSGLVFDLYGGETSNSTNLCQRIPIDAKTQSWQIMPF